MQNDSERSEREKNKIRLIIFCLNKIPIQEIDVRYVIKCSIKTRY